MMLEKRFPTRMFLPGAAAQAAAGGFTLLEVIIASGILFTIIMGTLGFIGQSQSVVNYQYAKTAFESQSQYVVDRMVNEIRRGINVQATANTISFRMVSGLDASMDPVAPRQVEYRITEKRLVREEVDADTGLVLNSVVGNDVIQYGLFETPSGVVGVTRIKIRLTFYKVIKMRPLKVTIETEVSNINP